MTTLEEISERGFAVIADVISPEVITAVVDELQKLLLVGSRRAGLRNLFHVSPLSRTLVHSETLQSLISPLLGKDVKCVRGLYFDKRREANWKVIVASRPDHRCKTTERCSWLWSMVSESRHCARSTAGRGPATNGQLAFAS